MNKKTILKGLFAAILSLSCAAIFGSSASYAEAVITRGLFTGEGDVRWEWQKTIDAENTEEPEMVSIMFYDKPATATTIVVPSLSDAITAASATSTLDTYYVRNADQTSQDAYFTTETRRESTTDVTVLDMTNTSKVQIMGVKPILNPETEAELIFGENMVIGDGVEITKNVFAKVCTQLSSGSGYYSDYYDCIESDDRQFNDIQDRIDGWDSMSIVEKQTYQVKPEEVISCGKLEKYNVYNSSRIPTYEYGVYYRNWTSNGCYIAILSRNDTIGGVFSGYRLKLTNLHNVKYFGWYAFSDSVFNESSRDITILANQTAGEGVFQNTNVVSVTFEGNEVFPAMFKDCSDLIDINFGNVETVSYSAFENVSISSLDLSATNVKTILGKAFKNTGMSELNLGSVERLGFEAFANNHITDLDFPKTINRLTDSAVFMGNPIQNVVVRYDTSQGPLPYRFVDTLGCGGEYYNETTGEYYGGYAYCLNINLKKLDIIAPYGEDEEVSATHVFKGGSVEYIREYFQPSTFKNIIAMNYFNGLGSVEEINIGDGYQYIGDGAFYSYRFGWRAHNELKKITFPESLLGIGQHAFEKLISGNGGNVEGAKVDGYWVKQAHPDVQLPSGLIYIGSKAFLYNTGLDTRFDLPDLEYLGNNAFENTNVMDIYFHHKLVYAGEHAFYYYTGDSGYNDGYHIWEGKRNVTFDSDAAVNVDVGAYYHPARVTFGNITFGEHVTFLPGTSQNSCISDLDSDYCYGGYGSGNNNGGTMWHKVSVDKFDLSASQIKIIPGAFFNGIFADEIVLPSGLKAIGTSAFYSATVNKELILPEGLEIIAGGAFNAAYYIWNCDPTETFYDGLVVSLGIKITKLPSSLKKVGKGAFFGDTNLTAVVDAELEDIRMNAFTGTGITGVKLHPTTKSVGIGAFTANEFLRTIEIDTDIFENYSMFGDMFGYGWVWNNSSSYTPSYAVPGPSINKSLNNGDLYFESVVFGPNSLYAPSDLPCPNGLYTSSYYRDYCMNKDGTLGYRRPTTESGIMSFFYGFNIGSIDLSATSWDKVPRNMFLGMKLEEVKLPDGINAIPSSIFYNAEIGGELKIPDSVTTINQSAFIGAKLETLILPSSLTSCTSGALWGLEVSGDIIVPEGVTALPDYMFSNIKAKRMELPESLETIGVNEFMLAKIDEELVLPNSLKEIRNRAFINADFLHSKYQGNPDGDPVKAMTVKVDKLPESLEIIGDNAFHGYEHELNLDLPNLKTVGSAAFMQSGIKSVKLYDKVEHIGSGAFLYNPDLSDVYLDCDFFGVIDSGWKVFYSIFSTVESVLPENYDPNWYGSQYQSTDGSSFNTLVFTDKNVTLPNSNAFAYFTINNLDISKAKWTTIPFSAFLYATVVEPITISDSVETIDAQAFQWSNITLTNTFSEGLRTIGKAAFYGAQVAGDLVIPSTVEFIGWAAFNAGDADANYNTVTIKPALDYDKTNNQAVFQLFWNAKMDKLIVESPMLPVLGTLQSEPVMPSEKEIWGLNESTNTYEYITGITTLRADGEPEFHGMTMKEAVITALPEITANAFEECAELEKVTFASDANLNRIDKYAFNNATKLKQVVFGEANNGHDINIEEYAFNNTAIESLGTTDASDFNLAAANFHTVNEHVFSNMPKLKAVEIPNNFNIDESMANADKFVNGAHITSFTFADDPELESVVIGYQIAEIRDGAFLNDEKLAKMFIWGNAEIQESDDLIRDFNNTTIPKGTMIFAYSDAPAEGYANAESRDNYEGKFYALDEVLYLTTNKTYVVLNDNKDDFDKTDLKLYALRRDGVILESDNWQEYTTAFPRSTANINFEEGRGAVGDDSANIAAIVYDAPKPFNTISLANQNFANVDFEFVAMPSNISPLVLINYPDGYTGNVRTATLASMTKEEEEEYLRRLEEELEVPNTGAFLNIVKTATPVVSITAIVLAGGLLIVRKRHND